MKLEPDEFQCITSVTVLAHECLIGMKMLVRWPAMKEAIRVLLKRQREDESDNSNLSQNPQIVRLHNICLPRIMANSELKSKLLSRPTKQKNPYVREAEITTAKSSTSEANREQETRRVSRRGRRRRVQGEVNA